VGGSLDTVLFSCLCRDLKGLPVTQNTLCQQFAKLHIKFLKKRLRSRTRLAEAGLASVLSASAMLYIDYRKSHDAQVNVYDEYFCTKNLIRIEKRGGFLARTTRILQFSS
jgi:hypothetical protein